jgi:hypothetical protein
MADEADNKKALYDLQELESFHDNRVWRRILEIVNAQSALRRKELLAPVHRGLQGSESAILEQEYMKGELGMCELFIRLPHLLQEELEQDIAVEKRLADEASETAK